MGVIDTSLRATHRPGSQDIPATELLGHAAELFRAMGDPARLRLLAMLQGGERCVGELVGAQDKLSTVSARLQALHRARLLHRRRAPDTSTTGSPTGTWRDC
jgi:hypothetical protein